MIKAKIESWGHQEFNNSLILKNLEENIKTGQDIFMREMGTNLSYVGLNDREFFDESMELILLKYPSLLAKGEIQNTKINFFEKLYKKVRLILSKIQYKLSLMIRN
jgi:hypothetical protein